MAATVIDTRPDIGQTHSNTRREYPDGAALALDQ